MQDWVGVLHIRRIGVGMASVERACIKESVITATVLTAAVY